jgi:hypothetical protein
MVFYLAACSRITLGRLFRLCLWKGADNRDQISDCAPAPTAQQIGELQNLYREMVKLTNEEQSLLNEEPSNILKTLDILIALRKASTQDDHDFSRASSVPKIRKQKPPKPEPSDSAAESPGPSPSFSNARLKGNGARSTSVVSARDSKEIKIEEGAEGAKGPIAEKAGKFYVGAEVAYKQLKPKEDGSQWIICNIISIDVKGPKRKYDGTSQLHGR